MAESIYTSVLRRAAEAHGSTQALSSALRVPESTLLRWMSGRAHMPFRAFVKLVELHTEHERRTSTEAQAKLPTKEPLTFRIGKQSARCAKCEGTQFGLEVPGPLKMTSTLRCSACGEGVIHGDLIVRVAKEAVGHAQAMNVVRARRQTDLLKRAVKPGVLKDDPTKEGE